MNISFIQNYRYICLFSSKDYLKFNLNNSFGNEGSVHCRKKMHKPISIASAYHEIIHAMYFFKVFYTTIFTFSSSFIHSNTNDVWLIKIKTSEIIIWFCHMSSLSCTTSLFLQYARLKCSLEYNGFHYRWTLL